MSRLPFHNPLRPGTFVPLEKPAPENLPRWQAWHFPGPLFQPVQECCNIATGKPSREFAFETSFPFEILCAKPSVAVTAAVPQPEAEKPRLYAYVPRLPSAAADCTFPSPSARVPAAQVASRPGSNDNGTEGRLEQAVQLSPAPSGPAPGFRLAGTGFLVPLPPRHARGLFAQLLPVLRARRQCSLPSWPSTPDSNGRRRDA